MNLLWFILVPSPLPLCWGQLAIQRIFNACVESEKENQTSRICGRNGTKKNRNRQCDGYTHVKWKKKMKIVASVEKFQARQRTTAQKKIDVFRPNRRSALLLPVYWFYKYVRFRLLMNGRALNTVSIRKKSKNHVYIENRFRSYWTDTVVLALNALVLMHIHTIKRTLLTMLNGRLELDHHTILAHFVFFFFFL